MMDIFLYWGFGAFLYFKIAISAAQFGADSELTVLSSLLISIIFCVTLSFITDVYAQKLLFGADTKNKKDTIRLTFGNYLIASIIFGIIARLIIFGFSRNLNDDIYGDREEMGLISILLLPLLLHYLTVIVASNAKIKSLKTPNEDLVAKELIMAAKLLGAKTPKEAAEITLGREMSNDEWQNYRKSWDKNW